MAINLLYCINKLYANKKEKNAYKEIVKLIYLIVSNSYSQMIYIYVQIIVSFRFK
jgi:hypothetical protein